MTIFKKEDIGKSVKCLLNGNGIIEEFHESSEIYKVAVCFQSLERETYSCYGELYVTNITPSLSFGHLEEDHNE